MPLKTVSEHQPHSADVSTNLAASTPTIHRQHPRAMWLSMLMVMLLTMILSLAGLGTAPIEGHEIFVVQTAREMRARGDWVVPWFNDQPRLNKPPLNYWLTEIVSIASGNTDVLPWHGRLVSATGGMLIVASTMAIAVMLGAASMSITAGLLAATSVGYLMFSHDGRPDMLYASLCSAMIALWLYAWQALKQNKRNRSNLASYAMWLALALATLSKGPHIPFLFIAIFIAITYAKERSIKQCMQLFHPLTGIALAIVLVVPWWLALYAHIGHALFDSQLAGKRYGMNLPGMLNPYYFYRTFVLILPWCLLWVFAGFTLFEKNTRGRSARLLFAIIFITLIALTIANGKRIVYVMPLLGPMSILMAMGAQQLIAAIRSNEKLCQRFGLWHTLIYTAVTLALIVITCTLHAQRLYEQGLVWIPILGIAGTLATCAIVLFMSRQAIKGTLEQNDNRRLIITLRGAAVIFAWFLLVSGAAATTSNPGRWLDQKNALSIQQKLPQNAKLYSLGVHPDPLIYYTRKPVHVFKSVEIFNKTMNAHAAAGKQLFVVTTHKRALKLNLAAVPLSTNALQADDKHRLELLHIHPSAIAMRWTAKMTDIQPKTLQILRQD